MSFFHLALHEGSGGDNGPVLQDEWGRSLGIDSVAASGELAVNRMRKNQGKTGPTRNNDRGFIGGGILSRPGSRRTRLRMELGLGVRGLVCGAC